MLTRFALVFLTALVAMAAPVFAESAPNYALKESISLPGPVRWDFLVFDAPSHRLFITRSDRVDVFDTADKKVVASIQGLEGVHGVALVPKTNKGFISEGTADRVTVFDIKTLKPIQKIPTGKKPDTVVYEKATGHVFVADADGDDFTVIDAGTGDVVSTIKLDGDPEFAVFDGKGKLYVNLEDKSKIEVIDTKTLKTLGLYNLAPACEGPTGLALDKASHTLFSVCASKHMVVVDANTGKIEDTLDIGGHPDAAIYDPDTGLTFSSNGEGTLTVVGKAADGHYKVLQTVPTKATARTMALDPVTDVIYLSAAETEGFDPPTAKHPEPRPHVKPDTFMLLTVAPSK